jgi:hypothetical protein
MPAAQAMSSDMVMDAASASRRLPDFPKPSSNASSGRYVLGDFDRAA